MIQTYVHDVIKAKRYLEKKAYWYILSGHSCILIEDNIDLIVIRSDRKNNEYKVIYRLFNRNFTTFEHDLFEIYDKNSIELHDNKNS